MNRHRARDGRRPAGWPAVRLGCRFLMAVAVVLFSVAWNGGAAATELRIGYLSQVVERLPGLSNLDLPPADEGVAGGRLALADNNLTGRFLDQSFSFKPVSVPPDGDVGAAFDEMVDGGIRFVLLNVPADRLLELADRARGRDVLLFNVGASDDRLRDTDCRDDVFHIAPSRSMLTDALAQFLVWKRWRNWLLVVGRRDGDARFAEAVKASARKFGARIVKTLDWTYGPDARRTAQSEVPVFTQGVDYDVLVVADEVGEFGEYLAYRTWLPRPVAGTQGLVPTTWHRTHEQWGAVQLQNRFHEQAGRWMTALDYQAWEAVRAVGEAATRTRSTEFAKLRDYVRGPRFELAGFKGQKLTFRAWNHQLRQPILLAADRALVSVSPQPGFLHATSLLDTLGKDAPETKCRLGG